MEKNTLVKKDNSMKVTVSRDEIQRRIYTIRGVQVMMDRDLAKILQVDTKALNQAVKRNIRRFPEWYMFQMTGQEWVDWKSQFVTTKFMHIEEIQSIKMGIRHDLLLIIDDMFYYFRSSLKNLRKRWFSVDIITEHL